MEYFTGKYTLMMLNPMHFNLLLLSRDVTDMRKPPMCCVCGHLNMAVTAFHERSKIKINIPRAIRATE